MKKYHKNKSIFFRIKNKTGTFFPFVIILILSIKAGYENDFIRTNNLFLIFLSYIDQIEFCLKTC